MKFWISQNSKVYGPYTLEKLHELIDEGRVTLNDMVCQDGATVWVKIQQAVPPPIVPEAQQFNSKHDTVSPNETNQKLNPFIASGLNFLITGSGYGYLGMWKKGFILLFLAIIAGLFTFGIGYLIPLIFSVIDCFITAQKINRGEFVDEEQGLKELLDALMSVMKR